MLSYAYHVTFSKNLAAISKRGLVPGSRSAMGRGGYAGHSGGKTFLSDKEGVDFWYERAEAAANDMSDDPLEEGFVPVVLRMPHPKTAHVDKPGSEDSRHEAWYVTQKLSGGIEVWDGSRWIPVSEWRSLDLQQAFQDGDFKYQNDNPLAQLGDDVAAKQNPTSKWTKTAPNLWTNGTRAIESLGGGYYELSVDGMRFKTVKSDLAMVKLDWMWESTYESGRTWKPDPDELRQMHFQRGRPSIPKSKPKTQEQSKSKPDAKLKEELKKAQEMQAFWQWRVHKLGDKRWEANLQAANAKVSSLFDALGYSQDDPAAYSPNPVGNPTSKGKSFKALPLRTVKKWEPLAKRLGVSKVARSSRGFLRAYEQAGTSSRLPEEWQRKRDGFIARHMAQAKTQGERWFERDGSPTRRHLALIMWAYSPKKIDRALPRKDNPADAYKVLFKHVEAWADTTSHDDVAPSFLLYSQGYIWQLFVSPCCLEDRVEEFPRFSLHEYTGDPDEVEVGLKKARGLNLVGKVNLIPSSKQLAEWYGGWANSGFDQIYEGEDVVDLENALEADMAKKGLGYG